MMFDLLVIDPMTNALLVLYEFLGQNFVLAIAVFTLLIRLVTLPLNLRQQKTSMKMQEVQPQVQAIQKKYKENPSKMQEEFKKIGYNPAQSLSGCLPTLIQFPILIGLYRAIIILLGSTPLSLFELTDRIYDWVVNLFNVGAALPVPNMFLWLNLSQPDPYYILPVLVFVTMFVQQKLMTPGKKKADDKKGKQKKQDESPMAGMTQSMQYTMPIMFAFFSLTFASGLSIYFIFSGLIGIAISYVTKNAIEREKASTVGTEMAKTTGIPAEATAGSGNGRSSGSTPRSSTKKRSKRRRRSAKR
jgi:YidC/Oxa1 family membrane protein insertase